MAETFAVPFEDLPGGRWVQKGLKDLRNGETSIEGLALRVYSIRLRSLGLLLEETRLDPSEISAEQTLYAAIQLRENDAYNCYNATLRELTSFIEALESLRKTSTFAA